MKFDPMRKFRQMKQARETWVCNLLKFNCPKAYKFGKVW